MKTLLLTTFATVFLSAYVGLWLARLFGPGKKYVQERARKPLWIRAQGYGRNGGYWREKYQRSFLVHKRIHHDLVIKQGGGRASYQQIERFHVCLAMAPWWLPLPPSLLSMDQ